ncbi:DUF418 domain-containing protein [Nonomuraea sp. NPDC050328]|uniref:DUF418 domain-containing protein n=1 Tax=Nonomuraea sp. NPDC050328 TaxID=3364361 RepID=UPI00378DBD1D
MSRPPSPSRRRIAELDVLRGFALCGIVLANIHPIAGGPPEPEPAWMGLLVHQRFFPIFSLLFGVGFSLLLESAARRTASPRLVLVRRLGALLALGLVHLFGLWPGDILTFYAALGLLVLLPSTWLPRPAVAALGTALVIASVVAGGERLLMISGLFLCGSALTRYGVIARLGESARGIAMTGLILAAGAAVAVEIQFSGGGDPGFGRRLAVAGLLVGGVYVCGLLLLLKTPARGFLRALFEPLGRTALTGYLAATVLVLAVDRVIGVDVPFWALAAGILVVEWLFATLWLSRFRQGPVEWLWRWATWAERPPLRRLPAAEGPPLRSRSEAESGEGGLDRERP